MLLAVFVKGEERERMYVFSIFFIFSYSHLPKPHFPGAFLQREFCQNFFKEAFVDGNLENFWSWKFFLFLFPPSDTIYETLDNIKLFSLID